MDTDKIEQAEQHIVAAMQALGFTPGQQVGTAHTPYRIAKYWESLLKNHGELPEYTTKKVYDAGKQIKLAEFECPVSNQLVVIRDIQFVSACEHHFLPVFGKCAVGYIPKDKIIGLSKFARIIRHLAYRPTTQEHVTELLGQHLAEILDPQFLGIHIDAHHTCMSCRGVQEVDSVTTTSYFSPSDQDTTKQEFYRNLRSYYGNK